MEGPRSPGSSTRNSTLSRPAPKSLCVPTRIGPIAGCLDCLRGGPRGQRDVRTKRRDQRRHRIRKTRARILTSSEVI
ncbi:hypothetical protein NDU88_006112 [Pleurodeles waltl]|uniref:Uncharacterized protein n=1 Tax=Pleurodeles waltl TaxID=8319 RepID=A0AAV7TD08_PLEWA|nr:hypothetical protein NDU88_006112 [Pleurodeles waltl]